MKGYKEIIIKTTHREKLYDITEVINQEMLKNGITDGICIVYTPHTTCGITINECADTDVANDIINMFSKIIPHKANYAHIEGNSDAHIKSSIVGASQTIIISEGKLCLGTWQGIFLCEFDGPRKRKVWLKFINT